METETIDPETQNKLLAAQRSEITEHFIYDRLSKTIKGTHNQEVLKRISEEELKHHNMCNDFTCVDIQPNKLKIWIYYIISRIFGVTFGLKLMERGEEKAHAAYKELAKQVPSIENVMLDEARHSRELIDLIDDERLEYSNDVVRGLTVGLVEITGTLAGFTFVLQNRGVILATGIIIGITLSLSLTGTEYVATKTSTSIKSPLKSAVYAGLASIAAVIFLLLPYIVFANIYLSLGLMILNAIIVVFIFTFYMSVAKDSSIIKLFLEMAAISLGIAALAFGIGILARELFGIHI